MKLNAIHARFICISMIVCYAYFDEFEFFVWFYWKCEGLFGFDFWIELKFTKIEAVLIVQVL